MSERTLPATTRFLLVLCIGLMPAAVSSAQEQPPEAHPLPLAGSWCTGHFRPPEQYNPDWQMGMIEASHHLMRGHARRRFGRRTGGRLSSLGEALPLPPARPSPQSALFDRPFSCSFLHIRLPLQQQEFPLSAPESVA